MASAAIRRLVLSHFRNYKQLELALIPGPVVLIGENGAGKTNLLEAISLLAPGRGLRRAALADLRERQAPSLPWSAFFELAGRQGPVEIGTGSDPEAEAGADKRIIHIDGRKETKQSELATHTSIFWLTPEMDRLLAESASERRRFADRLTFVLDPAHGTRVNRYDAAMRARAHLLREGPCDEAWISALEADMAREGIAIAAARLSWAEHLSSMLQQDPAPFPRLELRIDGMAEALLGASAALDAEDTLRGALKEYRVADAESGMTKFGPHRSDLAVYHVEKNCLASKCSTGEQKALLISLALAQARLVADLQDMAPLLLLDDATAHLDETRRAALCRTLLDLGLQAWLSGTDESFFEDFGGRAQTIHIKDGRIH